MDADDGVTTTFIDIVHPYAGTAVPHMTPVGEFFVDEKSVHRHSQPIIRHTSPLPIPRNATF